MKRVGKTSHAKINWFLRIGGRRADGFHELETIFQTISLADELELEEAREFSIECDDPTIPTDRRNLVWRAWEAMRAHGAPPVRVRLRKRIPAGGGLGGGSSNAAVTLLALSELFALDVAADELQRIAARLGSDVPFFLSGGTAYATGRGEQIVPLPDIPQQSIALLLPPETISTAECYARLAAIRARREVDSALLGEASARAFAGNPAAWWTRAELTNDLEEPAFAMVPRLRVLKEKLAENATFTLMSGSGSTLFAVGRNADRPEAAGANDRVLLVTTVGRSEV